MKALTISQPYASLIANGDKWVENRSWMTNYRGPLAIHAGKGTQFMSERDQVAKGLPRGMLIATVELLDCVDLMKVKLMDKAQAAELLPEGISQTDLLSHIYTVGPCCWILGNARKIEPAIEASGSQGLWECGLEIGL